MTARWKAEKDKVGSAAQAREALDRLRAELATAQRRGDLQRASEIAYGEIPQLEKRLAEAEAARRPRTPLTPEVVDAEQIAAVVSRWTGVPVEKMLEGEREKLLQMEDALRGRVVGQEEALAAVSDAVRRARAGLQDPNRPIGSLPVPGPHGRGQDRADQGAGRVHVRRRDRHHPPRHERVHGEALGQPHDRRASRLRRLRRGRRADRGRAPPALSGRAVRRGREGPPRRLQRAAAGAGRRPPDRRPGPHGRLPQHPDHHDLQPGLRVSWPTRPTATTSRPCGRW